MASIRNGRDRNRCQLDDALRALRDDTGSEGLGAAARGRVLQEAMRSDHGDLPELPALFAPRRWLATAAALPVVLALVIVALPWGPAGDEDGVPRVQVEKVNGELVFKIANGGKAHYVSRSTDPGAFENARKERVEDGVYRDRLNGAGVVFYRID